MAVPKRKTTPSKRNMRRAHDGLSSPAFRTDPDSGELVRPHHVDKVSGKYRGKQIITMKPETNEDDEADTE